MEGAVSSPPQRAGEDTRASIIWRN